MAPEKPNLVYVFGDQWRAQATGYAGDPNVKTPNLDKLSSESICFTNAVSGCPVCSPARAGMITGRYPLSHGVFVNDVYLRPGAVSIAQAYDRAGYETAYIGKWHLDGHGRSSYIPRERRQEFKFWKVLECTHKYNESYYYSDEDVKLKWEGYDAIAQTREAQRYINKYDSDKPFILLLSWGPPHNPYETAPEEYRRMYNPEDLILRPNVPDKHRALASRDLAGYYAHISAMDGCMGEINRTLEECGLDKNTILVFTSDHGDMHGSQSGWRKQRPWDESIMVPFLLRYPGEFGSRSSVINTPINTPDIMPTLLGLCEVDIPKTVEGIDYSDHIRGDENPGDGAALIACYAPFGEWVKKNGGLEYRGVRTSRYTYVRTLKGPWLLYDNQDDPYQLRNLCNNPEYPDQQSDLEDVLNRKLKDTKDGFMSSGYYIDEWGLVTDELGNVPYTV